MHRSLARLAPASAVAATAACGADHTTPTPSTAMSVSTSTSVSTSISTTAPSAATTAPPTSSAPGTRTPSAPQGSVRASAASSTHARAATTPALPLNATSHLCHSEGGDTVCSASEYAQNKAAIDDLIRRGTNFTESTPNPRLDALASGGPKTPTLTPTVATCTTYTSQVRQWAAYQNAHRPAGAPRLPTIDQQAYIDSGCQMGVAGG